MQQELLVTSLTFPAGQIKLVGLETAVPKDLNVIQPELPVMFLIVIVPLHHQPLLLLLLPLPHLHLHLRPPLALVRHLARPQRRPHPLLLPQSLNLPVLIVALKVIYVALRAVLANLVTLVPQMPNVVANSQLLPLVQQPLQLHPQPPFQRLRKKDGRKKLSLSWRLLILKLLMTQRMPTFFTPVWLVP